jgi:glutamate-5-semialdehyde dehydrogenase
MDNARGASKAILDRLELNAERIKAMAESLRQVAELPDPVGKILAQWTRPNGLKISRVSVPLGVIGIIYESRPNVTADAAGLALKSGNSAILRPGSDSFESSSAIMAALKIGLKGAGLPENALQLVPTKDRAAVGLMLKLHEYIDIIVPRGGKELIKRVMAESRIPVIQHLDGNCHSYVHEGADLQKAVKIVVNAKMRRCGICGATESLLVDEKIAGKFIPLITGELSKMGCEIRGDAKSQSLDKRIIPATEEDWSTEYLDAIISVKTVKNLDEAITHINRYGSHHTDSIITEDNAAAREFLQKIDSAIVIHNASTQFADGGEFGMGAEIGISTGRLHARGPVGVEQLTTYKYQVEGSGQIRP